MKVYSRFKRGPRVQLTCVGPGRTRQSMRDECDINLIMAKYAKSGFIDHLSRHGESYGFASGVSFHDAMNVVTKADSMFADLPAEARTRFHGDPAEFLDFVQDESNFDEMVELGLAKARKVPAASGGVPAVEPEPIIVAKPPAAPEGAETPA